MLIFRRDDESEMDKNFDDILMPINQEFLNVVDEFLNEEQRTKIRANNVRQYIEGIIDLLLRDVIRKNIKENESYEDINWSRKRKIIKEKYSEEIAGDINDIYRIGGDGSHFNGKVSEQDLQDIISKAIHIVEKIFVRYFLQDAHKFGEENIYTFFSMLPLKNRIYILESVYKAYQNEELVDRLSLAYSKNGQMDKAQKLLDDALEIKLITKDFYHYQIDKIDILNGNLLEVQSLNRGLSPEDNLIIGKMVGRQVVVGLPSSKNTFDVANAITCFRTGFETLKMEYPEFANLFLYLMQTDDRAYI